MQVHFSLDLVPRFDNAVVTIGSFDGVHRGHKTLLEQVIRIAGSCHGQSVVVTFEPHPRLVLEKNPPNFALLTSLDEKIRLIEDCGVDHLIVVPFTTEFARQSAEAYLHDFLVRHIRPSVVVVGYDHRYGAGRTGDFRLMEQHLKPLGIGVVEIDPLLIEQIAISSSAIRRALGEGDIKKVNEGLGHPYFIKATVKHGDRIGRTLGFPTANLAISERYKALPLDGIYLAAVRLGDRSLEGIAYIGRRPAVGGDLERVVEVHIFDFDEDIYGNDIEVSLLDFIRPDMEFQSLDELKAQMEVDKSKALRLSAHQAMATRELAVVVLNYNGLRHLKHYLPDLIRYSPEADIIIADNASTDGSTDYIRTFGDQVRLLQLDSNFGFTGGYNRAIATLDHTYILLLNSDVRVTPGWLPPLLSRIASDERVGAVQPKILNDRATENFDYAGGAGGYIDALGYPFCRGRIFETIEADHGQYDDAAQVFWASGAAMLTRRQLYMDAGGLDEAFFAHMEEIDLNWRMQKMGYSVVAEPASVVYHYGGGTLDPASPHKTYLNFRNSLFVLVKNEGSLLLVRVFFRLLLDGVAGIRFLFQGKASFTGAILKAHLHFYRDLPGYLHKRRTFAALLKAANLPERPLNGRWDGLLIWSYFVRGRKTFTDLKS